MLLVLLFFFSTSSVEDSSELSLLSVGGSCRFFLFLAMPHLVLVMIGPYVVWWLGLCIGGSWVSISHHREAIGAHVRSVASGCSCDHTGIAGRFVSLVLSGYSLLPVLGLIANFPHSSSYSAGCSDCWGLVGKLAVAGVVACTVAYSVALALAGRSLSGLGFCGHDLRL